MKRIFHFFLLISIITSNACSSEQKNEDVEKEAASPSGSAESVSALEVETLDYNGLKAHMAEQQSALVVYNFWATWCRPCIAELPAFEKLNQAYSDQGVKVVLVSLDFPDQKELMESFVADRKLQSEVIHFDDPNQDVWINGISPEWSGAIPATLLVSGGNQYFKEQGFTYEELSQWVASKL